MALRCQLCGAELKYDCKICHNCEQIAVDKGLRNDKKWRCDIFLELPGLPFGSNLGSSVLEPTKAIVCPDCGEHYSYGRIIYHKCQHNSIPFGKVFETECSILNWNCDTSMACTELLSTELPTVNSVLTSHRVEILANSEDIVNEYVGIHDENKSLLIYE
jgi:hypothetical protein